MKEDTKDNVKENSEETANENANKTPDDSDSSALSKVKNVVFGIIALAVLIVAGFAAAVKFDVLKTEDVAMLNEELGLYRLPFVGNGKFFKVPEGVEWPPAESESESENKSEQTPATGSEPTKGEPALEGEDKTKPKREEKPREVKIDKKAIEEQRAQREAEQKKRVTRLARIYESMKPEDAANALINVDWDTTILIFQRMSEDSVAQILAKMEPEAAAQLTEMLFAGPQRRVNASAETPRTESVTPSEQILTSD